MHRHSEPRGHFLAQIETAPTNHFIFLRVRRLHDQSFQFRHLLLAQRRRLTGSGMIRQSIDPLGVIAVHSVAQGLPIRPRLFNRLGPWSAFQDQGQSQKPPHLRAVLAPGRELTPFDRSVIRPCDWDRFAHSMPRGAINQRDKTSILNSE